MSSNTSSTLVSCCPCLCVYMCLLCLPCISLSLSPPLFLLFLDLFLFLSFSLSSPFYSIHLLSSCEPSPWISLYHLSYLFCPLTFYLFSFDFLFQLICSQHPSLHFPTLLYSTFPLFPLLLPHFSSPSSFNLFNLVTFLTLVCCVLLPHVPCLSHIDICFSLMSYLPSLYI